MKTLKKIASILLAVMLLAGLLAIPAGAGDGEHSLTIIGGKKHTFTAFEIFKGDLSGSTLSNIEWGDDVKSVSLLQALKDSTYFGVRFDTCETAEDVANVLKVNSIWVEADTKEFAKVVAEHTKNGGVTGAASGDDYVIDGLDEGYYLVEDTTTGAVLEDDAYSRYIVAVPHTPNITVKHALPTLMKKVSRAPSSGFTEAVSATVGESVYFSLTATMHKSVADYDAYKLVFNDTLPAGLTFVKLETVHVNLLDRTAEAGAVVDSSSNPVTITIPDARKLIKDATGNEVSPDDTVTVVFETKVNESATYGKDGVNINKATLSYSNHPYDASSMGKTNEESANVYTYQMQITKKDSTTNALLGGAKFKIWFESEQDGGAIKYLQLNDEGDGVYTVAALVDEAHATEAVTPASGANQGVILIKGVGSKSYHLQETKAPDGYNDIKTAQQLIIKGTADVAGELSSLTGDKDGTFTTYDRSDLNTGKVEFSVVNHQGAVLPSTGGMGTTIFYVLGAVMMVAAAVVLAGKKRFVQN